MLKKLLIIVVILVVLLIAALFGLLAFAGSLARAGIEKGGTYALGVPTRCGGVSIGLFSGKVGISGLDVGSPPGFPAPHFLDLGSGNVQVGLASLRQSTIDVPVFSLDRLDMYLEKKDGKANYTVILDNLQKVSGGAGGGDTSKPAPKPAGEEKKLIIKDLSLTNLTVHLSLFDAPGGLSKITVPIKEIKLQNVGQTGTGVAGSGVSVGQLSGIIVQAIMAAAIQSGGDLIPADIAGDLKGQLGKLGDVGKLGMSVVGGAAGTVEKMGGEARKAAEEVGKKAEDIKKGIEGLIPGKK